MSVFNGTGYNRTSSIKQYVWFNIQKNLPIKLEINSMFYLHHSKNGICYTIIHFFKDDVKNYVN